MAGLGWAANAAIGGWGSAPPTIRGLVVVAVARRASHIRREPSAWLSWVWVPEAVAVVPVSVSKLRLPSRSHWYLTIVPSEALEPEASKGAWPPGEAGGGGGESAA